MSKPKQTPIPDLGEGDYEVKLSRTSQGEEITELIYKKKIEETTHPTGQYL